MTTTATDAAWADVDVAAHRHRNHLRDAYSPRVECIALPVQSKLCVYRCRTNQTTGEFCALELLAQAPSSPNRTASPYLDVAWSTQRHNPRVFLAAATLTDVEVWEWHQATCSLESVRVLINGSPRIMGIHWHPHEPTLLVHTSSTLKLLSLDSRDADCEVPHDVASAKQLSCWSPSGTHLAVTGGAKVAVFSWLTTESCGSNTAANPTAAAFSSVELADSRRAIVGMAFIADHTLLATTERPVHVSTRASTSSSPFLIAPAPTTTTPLSTTLPSGRSEVVDLMHVKASSARSFLVLPELNDANNSASAVEAAVVLGPGRPNASHVLPELHTPQNLGHPLAAASAQAILISWTRAEPSLRQSAALDIPQLAMPDLVAAHSTGPTQGVVAIGSHLTSKTIVLGQYTAPDKLEWLGDADCVALPSRQVHGLRVTPARSRDASSVVVHVLHGDKPPGGFFAAAAITTRPLAYASHHRRVAQCPPCADQNAAPACASPPSSSSLVETMVRLQELIETRFDRVENTLRTLDRRLQRVEGALAP